MFILQNGSNETVIDRVRFLEISKTPKIQKENKSQLILACLRENPERAFYTTQIAQRLRDKGVTIRDISCNLRRYEKRGLIYFRGYRSAERETPFAPGYIVTYIDLTKIAAPRLPKPQNAPSYSLKEARTSIRERTEFG